jgi:pimeloyl-ACP methyl ester carboxylesterase
MNARGLRTKRAKLVAALWYFAAVPAVAQPAPQGPVDNAAWHTRYIQFGLRNAEGLLYEPAKATPKSRIALVYFHPNGNTFSEPLGPQMAKRGYRVLMVNRHSDGELPDEAFAPAISAAIGYLRQLPDVQKVVLAGHSGGGHVVALYQNAAENGPSACTGPEKIAPCDATLVTGLARPDGLVLLDPTLGTFHQANAIDPANRPKGGSASLDMFASANGYDEKTRSASYSPAFIARFHAAQAARSMALTAQAKARLAALAAGQGRYSDDEPMIIPGMGNQAAGARLYQPDTKLLAHTKGAYVTLKADGSAPLGTIRSVRPPLGEETRKNLGTLGLMTRNTTVRHYLAAAALRFEPGFALSENGITGVDWASATASTPGNARGIRVPTLVLTMNCHYLVVPDEIIFQNLAAKDKVLMAIEGATHLFQPCRAEYGDTVGRTFDAVGAWLGGAGRF